MLVVRVFAASSWAVSCTPQHQSFAQVELLLCDMGTLSCTWAEFLILSVQYGLWLPRFSTARRTCTVERGRRNDIAEDNVGQSRTMRDVGFADGLHMGGGEHGLLNVRGSLKCVFLRGTQHGVFHHLCHVLAADRVSWVVECFGQLRAAQSQSHICRLQEEEGLRLAKNCCVNVSVSALRKVDLVL